MTEDEQKFERARYFGRTSLAFGLAGLMLPWSPVPHRGSALPIVVFLGVVGALLSVPGLGVRSATGLKPGEPMAGLVANLMALAMVGLIWFFGLALSQHSPHAP